jgi:phenylacetate-CoA ligase
LKEDKTNLVNYIRSFYYLRSLLKRSYWSEDKLVAYQNKKLREIVRYAYDNVPFYHNWFRERKIRPEDLRTVKDLSKLSILRKEEVRRNHKDMVSKEFDIPKLKACRTSGSTGEPLHFYLSNAEDEYRKAKHIRASMSCGQRPRDKWVLITSPMYFRQATRLQKLIGFFAPISVSVYDDVATQIKTISCLNPDVLDGYASSILLLAKEIDRNGTNSITPKLLVSGADLIDVPSRKFVEKVFNAPLYDQYGCAELERLASQCEEKGDYHIDADSVVMQFVDENGEEVAPGESGEIVCTSLFNYAMPFIRYAIRDIGVSSAESCSCGRGFPVMKMVEGRADSFIHFPDGRIVVPRTLTIGMNMFSLSKCIERFRIIQTHKDNLDFIIQLKECNVDVSSFISTLEKYFEEKLHLKKSGVRMNVKFVDYLPLDQGGKLKSVVSNFSELRRES